MRTSQTTPLPRRIFFWTLFVLYFFTAALILFFAFGYRYSLERGIFIYGGSLTVKSNPEQVDIFIDEQEVSSKRNILNDSYHRDGFKPGEYLLRVSVDGFAEWSKKVIMRSGVSTEFWNVLLVREHYDRTHFDTPRPQRFFLSPRDQMAAILENTEEGIGVSILDREDDTSTPLIALSTHRFTREEDQNIEWSPDAQNLVIPVVAEEAEELQEEIPTDIALEDATDEAELVTPLTDFLITNRETGDTFFLSEKVAQQQLRDGIDSVRWDPQDKDLLYFLSAGTLYSLDITRENAPIALTQQIIRYDFADDGLYYLAENGELYRTNSDRPGGTARELTAEPIEQPKTITSIIAYDRQRIALLRENGELLLYNDEDGIATVEKIGDRIDGLHFSNDGKKLLYWSDIEIFVFFTRDWETQPVRQKGDRLNITRFSQPIDNVQWVKTFEHILFTVGNELKVIEIDHRDHRNIHTVLSFTEKNPQVVSDFADDAIFFIDANGDDSTRFSSISFPEEEGLF